MEDSPEKIAARAEQSDPIVMYLIVRESLGMGVGKIAAQCAHASQMLLLQHIANDSSISEWNSDGIHFSCAQQAILDGGQIFATWLGTSFRKVVLRADEKEWHKIKTMVDGDYAWKHVMVVDSGLTEVAPGSSTVIGLWPMYRSQVPQVIKRLQALK